MPRLGHHNVMKDAEFLLLHRNFAEYFNIPALGKKFYPVLAQKVQVVFVLCDHKIVKSEKLGKVQ